MVIMIVMTIVMTTTAIITQTFTVARGQIVVKRSKATKQAKYNRPKQQQKQQTKPENKNKKQRWPENVHGQMFPFCAGVESLLY